MDTTALEAQAAQLTSEIQADKDDITAKQAQLDSINGELANAAVVNAIESANIEAVNAALKADGSTLQIVDTAAVPPTGEPELPPATEDTTPETTEASS
jgi:hypothetical protein